VIPGLLPEPGAVFFQQFQAAQPLGALPQVRHDQVGAVGDGADDPAQRITVVGGDGLTVVMRGQQEVLLQHHVQRQVDGEAVLGVLHHVFGGLQRLDQATLEQRAHAHAFPGGVDLAPAGDAVQVHGDGTARELVKLVPRKAQGLFHQAVHLKIPGGGVEGRHGAVVQDGEFFGQRLAGGQAALRADTLFFFAAVKNTVKHDRSLYCAGQPACINYTVPVRMMPG